MDMATSSVAASLEMKSSKLIKKKKNKKDNDNSSFVRKRGVYVPRIIKLREEIIECLRDGCQVLIIIADSYPFRTGFIPLFLVDGTFSGGGPNDKMIACTLFNSEAAKYAASSTKDVIYMYGKPEDAIRRFDSLDGVSYRDTTIKFMSVDCLLQQMMVGDGGSINRNLSSYSAVIVDDAHKRTIGIDILLASLLPILVQRQSTAADMFRLVLTVAPSAAHEAEKFSSFFCRYCHTRTCSLPPIRHSRRRPPPMIMHMDPRSNDRDGDPFELSISTALEVHRVHSTEGIILLFLAGSDRNSAEKACRSIKERIANSSDPKDKKLFPVPLSTGDPNEISATVPVVSHKEGRRLLLILSPEVPDASPMLNEQITYVIDSGIGKNGTWTSQQSAHERAALLASARPRYGEPKCFRLYSESVYRCEMPPTTLPEILTCGVEELSAALRLLKQLGMTDPQNFEFIDPPPPQALASVMEIETETAAGPIVPDISLLSLLL